MGQGILEQDHPARIAEGEGIAREHLETHKARVTALAECLVKRGHVDDASKPKIFSDLGKCHSGMPLKSDIKRSELSYSGFASELRADGGKTGAYSSWGVASPRSTWRPSGCSGLP